MIVLETPRLILRHFTIADREALVPILGDPEVMRYSLDGVKTKSQMGYFLDRVIDYQACYGFSLYAVLHKQTHELIGFCGLLPWKHDGKTDVELGYRYSKVNWGKGYATEAASAICSYAQEKLKISEIYCLIDPENRKSQRVAQKLGMIYQKTTVFQGIEVDVYQLQTKKLFP